MDLGANDCPFLNADRALLRPLRLVLDAGHGVAGEVGFRAV